MIAKARSGVLRFACTTCLLLAPPAWGQLAAHPGDAAFVAARDAFAKGDRVRLERAVNQLGSHSLAAWGRYFVLVRQLDTLPPEAAETIEAFLAREDGTYLAEKLRGDWVRALAKREDWPAVLSRFERLQQSDTDLRCLALAAELHLDRPAAIDNAVTLVEDAAPLAEACHAPLGRLATQGRIPADALWLRLRQQLAQGRLKEGRVVAGWLPTGEAPGWQTVEAINDHPVRHLAKLPENFAETRWARELAMIAAVRMARTDVRSAVSRWREIEARFGASERAWVLGQFAFRAALGQLPEASEWFEEALALGANLSEEQHAWRVRSALRAGDWPAVTRAIDQLPVTMAMRPDWLYWQGRAHQATGNAEAAHAVWQRIADQPDFYGILAGEALGRRYAVPPPAAPPTAAELAEASGRVGLIRGLALIRTGMRIDGIREWNWALRGADDRSLLAAAELARRHEVIDRAINTADRTRHEHDFALRYPTPFIAEVAPRARAVDLDTAWVYGLMRQESRFITEARSSAGAQGLMQLMPATARWVARKIGMNDFRPGRVNEMDVNVTLGTNYLRMVLDSLDSHPVLASAAYNAGPGRARRWRGEEVLEGAIYAETIPFNETRDYVKKVMANTVVYAALRDGAAPSLTALLGTIRPRGFADGTAEDLP